MSYLAALALCLAPSVCAPSRYVLLDEGATLELGSLLPPIARVERRPSIRLAPRLALTLGPLATVDPAATRRGPLGTPDEPRDRIAFQEAPSRHNEALAAALLVRETLTPVHVALGIATWAAMAATAILGVIQLYDEYGFFEGPASTPCARHDAVLGFCGDDVPWPHLIAASTTTALYTATFVLSFYMPDPFQIARQPTAEGERLRIHEALRWAHLAGMIALVTLGAITASADLDYEARRALAWAHTATAIATFGTLTAAGAIVLF